MDLSSAIRKTIAYASFFDFPLFPVDIHYWLITSKKISFSSLKASLPDLSLSDQKKRKELEFHTLNKIRQSQTLASYLSFIPFLRFVGLTGSVAAHNAKAEDDIDLMIITAPHTLWLVRPVVLLVIGLFFRLRRPYDTLPTITNAFCPNLWLDTLAMSVPDSKRSLYLAHEVLQIHPILDKNNTYQSFLQANSWSAQFLANAYHKLTTTALYQPSQPSFIYILVWPLNYLSYLCQLLYMSSKRTSEVVHLHGAFLHTVNFSQKINKFLKST